MKRVLASEVWTLFDPKTAPGLASVHGAEFEALYERYEKEGRGIRALPAKELMQLITQTQVSSRCATG